MINLILVRYESDIPIRTQRCYRANRTNPGLVLRSPETLLGLRLRNICLWTSAALLLGSEQRSTGVNLELA